MLILGKFSVHNEPGMGNFGCSARGVGDGRILCNSVLTMALAVFIVLIISRIIGVKALITADKTIAPFEKSILSMMPRGLAAAVLALMPLSAGIRIPYFAEIVFSIIILTNLTTTFAVFIIERKKIARSTLKTL